MASILLALLPSWLSRAFVILHLGLAKLHNLYQFSYDRLEELYSTVVARPATQPFVAHRHIRTQLRAKRIVNPD